MSSSSSSATTEPVLTPASPIDAARALRHRRARKLRTAFFIWVLVPTLVGGLYFGAIATSQYESVAAVGLRGSDAATDAAMLREYLASRAALAELNRGGQLRAHYEQGGDLFSRLSSGASDETLFKYYLGKFDTTYDGHASVLTLRVRAFSSKQARAFAQHALHACQELLDRFGRRGADERIAAAEAAAATSQRELVEAQRRVVDLELAASAAAQLSAAQRSALEVTRFERSLAERSYEAARSALESARSDRVKRTYLVTIAEPSQPDHASYPRRGYAVMTVFFAALALFGIGSLLIAAVREHAQF